MFDRLVWVRGQLSELVTALDPDALSGQTARGWWAEFDRIERLAAAGKTLLARRVAATHQPSRQATRTAAEDLAQKAGTTTGQAKDAVNTSQRLVDQPGVEGALRRGELSPAQAAAISSAVAANPGEEERLVELASQVSLVELREECARVRAVADPDPEATNRRIHAARQLPQWVDGEGFWTLHAKGTPQAGAVFNNAIQPIIDQLFKDANRQGRREPVQAYAFDALIHLAQHATGSCTCTIGQDTATGDGDGDGDVGADAADVPTGGEKGGTDDEPVPGTFGGPVSASSTPGEPRIFAAGQGTAGLPCGVRPKATTNPRYLALLRVDVEALRRGHADDGELCEIAGVGPVPASVARAVLGEAIVKLVITNGVDVLNVTHLGRGPTAAQKAALLWVSPT